MTLGLAFFLIFLLYLIDKHGLWRRIVKITVKIAVVLVILVVLGIGAALGYDSYEERQKEPQSDISSNPLDLSQFGGSVVKIADRQIEGLPPGAIVTPITLAGTVPVPDSLYSLGVPVVPVPKGARFIPIIVPIEKTQAQAQPGAE